MKNLLIILFFGTLLFGCAKKTYTANSSKYSSQTTTSTDSLTNTASAIIDKTITIKTRQYDTSFNITGNKLTGYIKAISPRNINSHYENDDVSLDLMADSNGTVQAIAMLKTKNIRFKVNEKTVAYNDIWKTEQAQSNTKFKTQTQTDSLTSLKTELVEPSIIANPIKNIAITILLFIVLLRLTVYLFKKLNIVGRIIKWISGLV